MERMHQSYKCMKAQQKKLSGCACNLLAHEDLGKFEEAHHWNIQAKLYIEDFHQPMVVTKREHGAIMKHKCGKRQQHCPFSLFLSFFIYFYFLFGPSLFYGLFFCISCIWASLASFIIFVRSLIPTHGGIIVSITLSSLGQCSNNDDHHTFISLQLKIYNSILKTRYDSI